MFRETKSPKGYSCLGLGSLRLVPCLGASDFHLFRDSPVSPHPFKLDTCKRFAMRDDSTNEWRSQEKVNECLHIAKGKKEKNEPRVWKAVLNIYTCGHTHSRKFSSCVKFFSPANSSLNLEISCQQRDSESEYRKCQEKGQATSKCRGRQKRVSFGPTPTSKKMVTEQQMHETQGLGTSLAALWLWLWAAYFSSE